MLTFGDMFDIFSLLNDKSNEHISDVLEKTHLIQIPLKNVKKMLLQDEKFRNFFYAYVASQLKSMEELAVSLSFYDVYQRILHLFRRFIRLNKGKKELQVINNLNHEDLASMIGTVRKVLNRSLQKLKKDGIIDISRKNIHIKNFKKLLDSIKN